MASTDPDEGNKEGPDVFGFYSRGVAELLRGENDFLPFAEDTTGEVADKGADTSGYDSKKGDGCSASSALFHDGVAPGLSDTRRERLKSFLRQAAFDLSLEVDKMHEPVLKLHQLQTRLKSSRQQLTCSAASSDGDVGEHPQKKIKRSSSSSSASISERNSPVRLEPSEDCFAGKNTLSEFCQMDQVEKQKVSASETRSAPCQSPHMSKSLCNNSRSKSEGATVHPLGSNEAANKDDGDSLENGEQLPFPATKFRPPGPPPPLLVRKFIIVKVNADLQLLLGSDRSLLDQMLKKYSNEHCSKLEYMGKQLEELLDAVMSKCRSMTRREKIQLQKLIQNLPQDNLERVVGILGRRDSLKISVGDDISVDLEKEDNGTLWRLYYYVQAVEKARKLSAIQGTLIDSNGKKV